MAVSHRVRVAQVVLGKVLADLARHVRYEEDPVASVTTRLLDETRSEGVREVCSTRANEEPCRPTARAHDDLELAVRAVTSTAFGKLGFDRTTEALNRFQASLNQGIERESTQSCRSTSHDRNVSLSVTNGQADFPGRRSRRPSPRAGKLRDGFDPILSQRRPQRTRSPD